MNISHRYRRVRNAAPAVVPLESRELLSGAGAQTMAATNSAPAYYASAKAPDYDPMATPPPSSVGG